MRHSPTTTYRRMLTLIALLIVGAAQTPAFVLAAPTHAQTGPSVPIGYDTIVLSYDPSLVARVTVEDVPDNIDPDTPIFNVYEHISFQVSANGAQGISGAVDVYPLLTDGSFIDIIPDELGMLMDLTTARLDLSLVSPADLPEAPPINATRDLTAQAQYLETENGAGLGLRYLARWTQDFVPIRPDEITYVYQGMSESGDYWIDARFAAKALLEALPAPDQSTLGYEAYVDAVVGYNEDMILRIQQLAPEQFTPRLADIDAMIATLTTEGERTDQQEQSVGGQIAFLEGADGSYEVEVYDLRTQTTTIIGSSIDTPYDFTGQLVGWSLEGAWLVVTNFGQTTTESRYDLARVSPDGRRLEKLSFFNPGSVLAPLVDGMMLETSPHAVVSDIMIYNSLNDDVLGSAIHLGYAADDGCLSEYMTAVGAPTHAIVVAVDCVTGPDPGLAIQKLVGMQESGGTHIELGEMLLGQKFDQGTCAGSPRGIYAPALSPSAKLAYVESDTCYSADPATGPIDVPGGSRILLEGSARALVESPQRIESISWSPDEQWIAYGVENGLYAVQVATGAVVKLYTGRNTIKDVHWNPATSGGKVITPVVATNTPTAAPTRTATATPTPELTDIPVSAVTLDSKGDDVVLSPGATFQYWVNVRNSGTLAWTREHHGYRRTGQWADQSSVEALWRDVAPGEMLSFSENVTAPTAPGVYNYGFFMQHEGRDFGPEFTIKVTVQDGPPVTDDASPDGACQFSEVAPGATYPMTYTIRNTGTSTWTPADYVFLLVDATSQPAIESAFRLTESVPPGGTHTFTKTLQAPQQPGDYRYNYFMRHGDVRFGFSCDTTVRVAQQAGPGATPQPGEDPATPKPRLLRLETKRDRWSLLPQNWSISKLSVAGYDDRGIDVNWSMEECSVGMISVCKSEIEVAGKWTGVTDLRFTLHSRANANNDTIEDGCIVDLERIEFSGWQEFWARILGRDLLVTVTYNTDTKQCGSDPPARTADG